MGDRIRSVYNALSEEEKNKDREKIQELLAAYYALLRNLSDKDKRKENLTALASERLRLAWLAAVEGLGLTVEQARDILNTGASGLTNHDQEIRKRLVAALDNLAEFSAAEEYQLMEEVLEEGDEDVDTDDDQIMVPYIKKFDKYNQTYRTVEDKDIGYALTMAAAWVGVAEDEYLTYWTQNDDRVRPWHYALQGTTYRKKDFPGWLIPPIEWACRCFLVSSSGDVFGSDEKIKSVKAMKEPEKPADYDGVFSESICQCGRIFSKSHPYFEVGSDDVDMLASIVDEIKKSYYDE